MRKTSKTLIGILGLYAIESQAQTFVNFKITNFDTNGNGSLTFSVPTNTLFKIVSASGNLQQFVNVLYPEATNQVSYPLAGLADTPINPQILGPANVTIEASIFGGGVAVLMGEFDVVNTAPALQGFAVQPNGQGASITLQSSLDLVNWQTATNGLYNASPAARFFRMAFQVNP
jgi:hypothetical protein